MIEDFQGESLADFVVWATKVLVLHPDAKIWTYESITVNAWYDSDKNCIVTS